MKNKTLFEFIENKPFNEIKDIFTEPPFSFNIDETEKLYLLKYNQIETDMSYLASRQARGIILEKNTNKIIAYPFNKFFNYGEELADEIDWNSAVVQEKIDGSIIKTYFYDGEWRIATNGKINAFETELQNTEVYKSFGDLFMAGVAKINLNFFDNFDKNYTYMFELCSPYNRVVVPFEDIEIYHTGTRNNITFEEMNIDIGIQKPKVYRLNSLEEVIAMAKELPFNEEGYVVVDKYWNRLKVKSPAYVSVHHLHNNGTLSKKRILELIRMGEDEEYLSYYPEDEKMFLPIKERYEKFISLLKILEKEVNGRRDETRKDFALWATKQISPSFLFKKLDNSDYTIEKYLEESRIDVLLNFIDKI